MVYEGWREQVKLLLAVLPEVGKENVFALHGGTAINLFVRDLPRLSVDIDLTFASILGRRASFDAANESLAAVASRLPTRIPSVSIRHRRDVCKLQVATSRAAVKVEVNMVGRGLWGAVRTLPLCDSAQEAFDAYCAVPVVSHGQLFGGKLCAALDRQHPRDLFDAKLLLDQSGLDTEVRSGLLLAILSSPRPTHELLAPHLLDQRTTFERHFAGMTTLPFCYTDYEQTRTKLIDTLQTALTPADRAFLLSVNRLEPDWKEYQFTEFPAVRWKLHNLERFRRQRPHDWAGHLQVLERVLYG